MKLTRNTLYALIQLLALRLPNVAVMLLLTRRYGAYETGVFGLAVTYALLLTVWWAGPDELAVREMARARASRALRHYAWRRLLIATALCAAAIAFTWLWGGYPPETRWFVAIVLLGTIPEGPMGVIQAGLLGYERFRPAMLVSLVQTALRLLLCGAALLAGGSLIWVAIGWTAASFASSLIALFALGDVLRQGGAELEAPGIDWRREGWAFVSIGILATLEYQVDVVLLSYFRSISEVGFYSAALTLFGAASLPAQAARLAVLPAMTRAAGGQAESLARLYRRTLRYLLALALPVAVLGGAFADRLVVLLFGPAMRPTGRVLAILMVALPLVFLNVPQSRLLLATDQQRRTFYFIAISSAANVLANVVLGALFGPVGAAVARIISTATFFSLAFAAVVRVVGLPSFGSVAPPFVAALVMALYLRWLVDAGPAWLLGLVAVVVYVAVFTLAGGVEAREWAALRGWLQRRTAA